MKTFTLLLASIAIAQAAETIPLWNGGYPEPDGKKKNDSSSAKIIVHLPANPNGAAMVICPGGGYGSLVMEQEGHGIAKWLNANGIAGIVLQYRLPKGRSMVPLLDAQQAIRTVRKNAAAWKIDSDKVGVIGFSAGGHLAACAAVRGHISASWIVETLEAKGQGSRPDFAVLIYPVISMEGEAHRGSKKNLLGEDVSNVGLCHLYSAHKHVNAESPPAFLAHAIDDKVVGIENSRMFYEAQKKAGRPARLVELPNGGHGLNGYKGPSWDKWQAEALVWLKEIKVLP
ncbi:MAG: Acetylxylan esterase precursor [Verrucomicrobiota bacterium]